MSGGSINMISLFALIMSLGIIVDDTIVVGEESLTNTKHMPLGQAIEHGAKKMLAPITAASLTTIAAFIPLLVIGNIIGAIIQEIPFVVICVILASIVECFLVLPGHLYHSLNKQKAIDKKISIRQKIQNNFEIFTQTTFKTLVKKSIKHRWTTIVFSLALFVISISLVVTGRVPFNFFPAPEGRLFSSEIQFISGTNQQNMDKFINHLLTTLNATNALISEPGEPIAETILVYKNTSSYLDPFSSNTGSNYASIQVETRPPELRSTNIDDFIVEWDKKIIIPEFVENFSIAVPKSGPPGKDLDIVIISLNDNVVDLQNCIADLTTIITDYNGLYNIKSDLGASHKELLFSLTKEARAMGLTQKMVGSQLRSALNGEPIQTFYKKDQSVEVWIRLAENERNNTNILQNFPIFLDQGPPSPLKSIINITDEIQPDSYTHLNNQLTTHLVASINSKLITADKIINELKVNHLKKLESKYNVKFDFVGKAEEQAETFSDMLNGLILGIILIYIILAWVFASYGWPLIVMAAIPLGLTGAIFGHMLMNIDLTILSIFGLFGLSGIVINDSIILINEYKNIHNTMPISKAIVEAAIRRLRPVFLTSLTTVVGLIPLLLETSLQAQFLIPMATAIAAGLAYSTMLILFFIPSMLYVYESRIRFNRMNKYKKSLNPSASNI